MEYDVIIVGGGFYGCMLALSYHQQGKTVLVVEKAAGLLLHASANNQARVHNGYHYPRSFLTAHRSHENYARFQSDFSTAISYSHTMLYAIAKGSKTTPQAFQRFCQKVGIPLLPAPRSIVSLFNQETIESVFLVDEVVFDVAKLRTILRTNIVATDIEIKCSSQVVNVSKHTIRLADTSVITGKKIVLCNYAGINRLLLASSLPILPLKHEDTRMPLVSVPKALQRFGMTIMDGDYFSLLPFPGSDLHTLHHVKYTPTKANWQTIQADCSRFIPLIAECLYKGAINEVKVVLKESEETDSRPILYRKNYHLTGLDIVLGSKLDEVYDILELLNFPETPGLNIV